MRKGSALYTRTKWI